MSADDSSDPGRQRTVAELLAQHGGGSASGSRRRRRAPEADDAQESAGTPTDAPEAGRDEPGSRDTSETRSRRSSGSSSPDPQLTGTAYPAPTPAPQVPEPRWAGGSGYGESIDPITGEPLDAPSAQTFGSAPRNAGTGPGMTGAYRAMPLARTDPPTEELPLYLDTGWAARAEDAGPLTGPVTGAMGGRGATGEEVVKGPATGMVSRADLFDDTDDDTDDADDADDAAWGRRASAAPAGLAERGEHGELADEDIERDEGPVGVLGWLGLIVQWVVGAVAGALLWVGFSYLWMNHQIIALIASLVTTATLVLVVRAIRRRDDLQTTMLAVLVGLVVTISPAVLLLAVH